MEPKRRQRVQPKRAFKLPARCRSPALRNASGAHEASMAFVGRGAGRYIRRKFRVPSVSTDRPPRIGGCMRVKLMAIAVIAIAAAAVFGVPGASSGTSLTNPKHFFWAKGQPDPSGTATSTANDLIYHGGNAGDGAIGIEKKPAVYLVFWGAEWASGFTTPDSDGKLYSSKTLQNYVESFFSRVGGSAWAGVQTQ